MHTGVMRGTDSWELLIEEKQSKHTDRESKQVGGERTEQACG